jgi:hypothetical protein
MAMVNGTYEITSTGTAVEFFTAVKDAITTYTDWTVETGGDLELTCTTSVPGATVHIYDKSGTSSSSSSKIDGLYFEYVLTSDTGTTTNKTTISYASSVNPTTTSATRKIYMHVYENVSKNIYYIEFTRYDQLIPVFGFSTLSSATTNFGLFNSTNINDGTSGQTLIASRSCYDPSNYSKTAGTVTQMFTSTSSANGVVMVNYLITRSNYIVERFDNVYNCTTLSQNYTWSINNKKYLTFGTNTLFEL